MLNPLTLKKMDEDQLMALYAEDNAQEVRNVLVERYLYIAEIVAKKFANRGVDFDDLFQVASMALIKAIERFDMSKGFKFSSFATPTIVGEVKNYFRDKSRIIRLPRRQSEYLKKMESIKATLIQQLGRIPMPAEIAKSMAISLEDVLELMESSHSTNIASLDFYIGEENDTDLMAIVGSEEADYERVLNHDFIERVMSTMTELEQKIITERFFNERSQRDIAQEIGVSQMYISRTERKLLSKFKLYLDRED